MIKEYRLGLPQEITSIGRSIIPSRKERDRCLKKISEAINEDIKINQSREIESIELAKDFIPRPRL